MKNGMNSNRVQFMMAMDFPFHIKITIKELCKKNKRKILINIQLQMLCLKMRRKPKCEHKYVNFIYSIYYLI